MHALSNRPAPRRAAAACLLALALALGGTGVARATDCPKDKVLTEHLDIGWKKDVGIRRKTVGLIPLKGWRNVGDLILRQRRLTIPPGGIIPTHEHWDRPSIVYILNGELIEHNSKCAVPIVHHAGDTDTEFGNFRHWWENKTDKDVIVIGTDIVEPGFLDDPAKDDPM